MNYQYFIGIELPDNLSRIILEYQKANFDNNLHLKPITPHITLMPPGPLASISPMYLKPKLKYIIKTPLNIRLSTVGNFNKTVLFLIAESKELSILHQDIIEVLPQNTKSIYFVGKNQFTPHVTILQAKNNLKFDDQQISTCTDYFKGFDGFSFKANNISIFTRNSARSYSSKLIS